MFPLPGLVGWLVVTDMMYIGPAKTAKTIEARINGTRI